MYEPTARTRPQRGNEWQRMDSAPRDGTPIEIECRYGVRPWRRVGSWRTSLGGREGFWQLPQAKDHTSGWDDLSVCWWRPFSANVEDFWDPYAEIDEFDYFCGKRPLFDGPLKPSQVVTKTAARWWQRFFSVAAQVDGDKSQEDHEG